MGLSGRGSLQSVDQLAGVGPQLAQALAALGFASVEEISGLRPGQANALADVVPGISRQGMRRAVTEAALRLVSPDAASIAPTLIDEGITDVLRIVAAPTQTLVGIGGSGWNTERAALLQVDAARAQLTFRVLLRVVDDAGDPIAEPRVEVADSGLADRRPVVVGEGDVQGWVLTPPLRRDREHRVFVTADGCRRVLVVRAGFGPVQRRTLVLARPPRRLPSAIDHTVLVGPATYLFDEITLGQAADGRVFRVGELGDTSVPIRSVTRTFTAGAVITEVAQVPISALPAGVREGAYVVVRAGALQAANDDERDAALCSRGGVLVEGIGS